MPDRIASLCVCPGGSGAVVRIGGEIDVRVADRLQELLLRIMRAHGPRLLRLVDAPDRRVGDDPEDHHTRRAATYRDE
jgi:hypothetical protein